MRKGDATDDTARKSDPEATSIPKHVDESPTANRQGRSAHQERLDDHSMSNGKQPPTRLDSSPPQSLVHEIHTHPHRRHFPHHLLDHFSKDLDHPDSPNNSTITSVQQADGKDTADKYDQTPIGISCERARGTRIDTERSLSPAPISTGANSSLAILGNNKSVYSEDSHQWPFFGTESRILPSGRRVSFLKQACWAFSPSTQDKDKDESKNMSLVCPKAFREPVMPRRRTGLRRGRQNEELKPSNPSKSEKTAVDLDKFKNESFGGPSCDSLHVPMSELPLDPPIHGHTAIIDSSSTQGKHPVPKAPGIMHSSGKSKISKSSLSRKGGSKKIVEMTKKFIHATTSSPSPTRRKLSQSPKRGSLEVAKKAARPVAKKVMTSSSGGTRLLGKPKCTALMAVNMKQKSIDDLQIRRKSDITFRSGKQQLDGRSPESLSRSFVSSEGGNDSTSTCEELSADKSDISDRNFLIDYGDPSKLYFRNEWESRMQNLNEKTSKIRKKIELLVDGEEVILSALDIIDDVEKMKVEMGELYDYFDHFEREEDTLLQQVQRQLNQANRYCKIMHYRVEKAVKYKVDKKRIAELEEELKLSRQVAVSLHWELQTVDEKQSKLEKENRELRHKVVVLETEKDVLTSKAAKLQYDVDQMSLHAPSHVVSDNSEGCMSSDSTSEIKRQIQFMDEKETVIIARLVDVQKERDNLKDTLDQYKDAYGELPSAPAPGANRQTDLKLRLKLAEDQSGLLARKVIEMQLENDNMVKLIAEKDLVTKEAMKRKPSISDLQFLEDERESLRLALDEMEIENQKLAAELLRYKQAVHRQLHSNSLSTESPLDVGIVLRVPRSNESVFDDDNSHSRSKELSGEQQSVSQEVYSDDQSRERKMLRPLSLVSPSSHSLVRNHSLSRTLSDIAIPLSPDMKTQSVQITPTNSNGKFGSKSSSATSKRKSVCQKCKKSTWIKSVDVAVGTDLQRPKSLLNNTRSIGIATLDVSEMNKLEKSSQAAMSQDNTTGGNDVATQAAGENKTMHSRATSPLTIVAPTPVIPAIMPETSSPRRHNALLEEMRKQLAHVRNIAESMDNVVNINEIDAEMRKRGKDIVDAECKRTKEHNTPNHNQISKLAKSLQKYIRDIEHSVSDESDGRSIAECKSTDDVDWNLHGNAEAVQMKDPTTENDSSTLSERSSSNDVQQCSLSSTRSFAAILWRRGSDHIGLKVLEAVVMLIVMYILITSLPSSAILQVCFLLLLFFVC